MSGFLYRLGQRCARHPFRVLGIWLLIAVSMFALKGSFGGGYSDKFTVPGVESQQATDTLKEKFPEFSGTSGRIVFRTADGRIDEGVAAAGVHAAVDELAQGQDVVAVNDPFDAAAPTVSADGATAFVDVKYTEDHLDAEHYDEAEAAVGHAREAGVQAEITGSIADAAEKMEGNEGIGLLVAAIVLVVAFGSLIAAGIPIGTALFGLAVGMSGVGLLAGFTDVPEVSPMLGMMIGLGVGIDYALFIITRHRQHLHEGMSVEESAGIANATAGQAVLFAGTTVVIAIVGLLIAGLPAVTMMGFSTAIIVIISMLVAVTLLPAFLGWAGEGIDRWTVGKKKTETTEGKGTLSAKWADHVGRHPWRYTILSSVLLIVIAIPTLGLRLGMSDDGVKAESTTQRQAYELLADGYGEGFNGPFHVVVDLPDGAASQPILEQISASLAADEHIVSVAPAAVNEAGDTAVIVATPDTSPQDEQTKKTLESLRNDVLPAAVDRTGAVARVTGQAAALEDVSVRIQERLPLFIFAVVMLSFLLLMVVFRSILVPLKAAIMNMISIAAAYGVIVAVFQWGWGKGLVGLEETVPINPFVPMIMFAILFGLSMDYEVFLLSRVREEFVKSGDSHKSVVDGLASTARVITSAALIMISVFLAFVSSDNVSLKMFGLGLATAVFLDATLVRMVLVPSTMSLLGGANWWLPRWLDRILPHLDLEAAPDVAVVAADEPEEQQLAA